MYISNKFSSKSIATLTAIAAVLLAPAFSANADSVEWSLLGPAWSKHMGTEAAVMHDEGSPTKIAGSDCSSYATDPNSPSAAVLKAAGLPSTQCAASGIKNTRASSVIWNCGPSVDVAHQGAGGLTYNSPVAKCSLAKAHRKPIWHQMNPAFGLARTVQHETTSDTMFVGFARDSYGSPTVMAGVTHAWRVLDAGSVRADAGLTAGLWWRTEMRYTDTSQAYYDGTSNWSYSQHLVRRLEPVVLPMLALTEKTTGIGLNVMYAPNISLGGYSLNSTSTWMFQTTVLVRSTHLGDVKVGIEPQPGGATASLTASF